MKYLIKIKRKAPNKSYWIGLEEFEFTPVYKKAQAERFDNMEQVLEVISLWACGGDEEPEVVKEEVAE